MLEASVALLQLFMTQVLKKQKLTPCGQTLKLHVTGITEQMVESMEYRKRIQVLHVYSNAVMLPKHTQNKKQNKTDHKHFEGPKNKPFTDINQICFRRGDERKKSMCAMS